MQPRDVFVLARRSIELQAIADHLPTVADRTLETIRDLEREYASPNIVLGYAEIRTRLIRCELATYEFVTHLFSLAEITSRVTGRHNLDITVDPRQALRPLLGLRNAITHNGLIGFNIVGWTKSHRSSANVICTFENVRAHAEWGDKRARHGFNHYFGDLDGVAITVAQSILRGLSTAQGAIVDLLAAVDNAVDRAGARDLFSKYRVANALNRTWTDSS